MWFKELTGFEEQDPDQVRRSLKIEEEYLTSLINGKSYKYGQLEIPTLQQLRNSITDLATFNESIRIEEVVANVQHLHMNKANAGAVFQAASQFNLLEMTGPNVIPEQGIGIYEFDNTQGPACAIACGAGTIYRNYFAPVNDAIGQTKDNQIDCLDEIGKALDNENRLLWKMQNGYALAQENGLKDISNIISRLDEKQYDDLKVKLKIGIQRNTQVTIFDYQHDVTQVYCSALPIAYSQIASGEWEKFARLVLEATYEATFCAAIKNYEATQNPLLFLTLVGGGVFGNDSNWIFDAIRQAMKKFSNTPLEVKIVSYGRSNPEVKLFVNSF